MMVGIWDLDLVERLKVQHIGKPNFQPRMVDGVRFGLPFYEHCHKMAMVVDLDDLGGRSSMGGDGFEWRSSMKESCGDEGGEG